VTNEHNPAFFESSHSSYPAPSSFNDLQNLEDPNIVHEGESTTHLILHARQLEDRLLPKGYMQSSLTTSDKSPKNTKERREGLKNQTRKSNPSSQKDLECNTSRRTADFRSLDQHWFQSAVWRLSSTAPNSTATTGESSSSRARADYQHLRALG
jgi:hypothetical protein